MEDFSDSSSDPIPTQHSNVSKNKLNYTREYITEEVLLRQILDLSIMPTDFETFLATFCIGDFQPVSVHQV